MITETPIYPSRLLKEVVIIALLFILGITTINAQGFKTITSLTPITATTSTGEKPQSKVWKYDDQWFAIIPVSSGSSGAGTYIYRLDGTSWTQLVQISTQTAVKADVKVNGAVAYVLLKNSATNNNIPLNQPAWFITINYSAGSYTLGTTTSITLDNFCETATIDIDSGGRIWLASDGGGTANNSGTKNIYVRFSDPPYSSFSSPITIETGVNYDDICDLTAFSDNGGNKIGIMWSDQILKKFGFAYHEDNAAVYTWNYQTVALDASSGGIEDDHINFAVASDGTIYAAVKTSYTASSLPTIGLLVRHPNGTWDPIYPVTKYGDASSGTRPIVLLNEAAGIITVAYTERDGYRHIVYKESPTSLINFPANSFQYLKNSSNYDNDVTSTKQNYTDDVVFLFSNSGNNWNGVIAKRSGQSSTNGAGLSLNFDGNQNQLEINNSTSINISGLLTIEAWIHPNSTKYQSILNKTTGSDGYELDLTADGKIRFAINGTSGAELLSTSSYVINTWTHVAATYVSGSMKIYINGTLDSQLSTSVTLLNNTNTLYIGAFDGYGNYDGYLDEIRLWNKERTIDEIRANMCKKLTGSESNLVAYWNFDNEEGLNVPDKTSNNNYGSMYDMENYQYFWSGASIGDASAYDYDLVGGFTQTLSHPDGDMFNATATSGSVTGIQLYRVDSSPLRPEAVNSSSYTYIDTSRYWGVKLMGTGSTTYDITYDYLGLPGIPIGSDLNLAYRDNLSDSSWKDLGAFCDQGAHTLTKTGLTGTEFALVYSENNSLNVSLKVFLEGPYNGAGGMTTYLNSNNLIPLNSDSAYSTATYGYTASVVDSIPNADIVDWVLVELRTGTSDTTKVGTRAAFIKSDGTIVDTDGSSPVLFTGLSAGNYYVVVRHRNHLAIMSSTAIALSANSPLYDFTTSQTQAYTSGTDPLVSLSDGAYGMIAGDTNGTNIVSAADFTPIIININTAVYSDSDVNMSAVITAADFTKLILNLNKATNVPN